MYSQSIKATQKYSQINKCISILLANFELKPLKNIPEYMTTWNFREKKYSHIVLTDSIEIIILELPKVQKYSDNTKLKTWLNFISTGDLDMKNADNSMKQAKEILDLISNDSKERYLA